MTQVTKLKIKLSLKEGDDIANIDYIPAECEGSFQKVSAIAWEGEFIISCPSAPELSPGDFEDDLAPQLHDLLLLKKFHRATYDLQIAVGSPGPDTFDLQPHSVALLAALGASITVIKQ